jgi:hypothetical protein
MHISRFLAVREVDVAQGGGDEGEMPMRDWMAFATAAVVALLTKMLLA